MTNNYSEDGSLPKYALEDIRHIFDDYKTLYIFGEETIEMEGSLDFIKDYSPHRLETTE